LPAAPLAEPADFELVHAKRYVAALGEAARQAPVLVDGGDRPRPARETRRAARWGALRVVDRAERRGRTPSPRDRRGITPKPIERWLRLFNQVAIAARHLRSRRGPSASRSSTLTSTTATDAHAFEPT
jgi:hypothetical protein